MRPLLAALCVLATVGTAHAQNDPPDGGSAGDSAVHAPPVPDSVSGAGQAGPDEPAAEGAEDASEDGEAVVGPPQTDDAPDSEGESEDAIGDSGLGSGRSIVPVVTPGSRINNYRVQGTLIDDEDILRGYLDPLLKDSNWSARLRDDHVMPLLARINYRASVSAVPSTEGGVSVIITLEPVTLVRNIVVKISGITQSFFADEIQRKMTLRPGSPMPSDKDEREALLRKESTRLLRFLQNDGFFDAKVKMSAKSSGPHAAKIKVSIHSGSPYRVGTLRVTGNTAINSDEIVAKFRHRSWCLPLDAYCFRPARFLVEQLNKDVAEVEKLYQRRGYPGVQVRTTFNRAHSYKRESKTVEFTIQIRERRKIDVVFEGNSRKFPDEQLKGQLTLSQERSYGDIEIQASADAIRRHYQEGGYFEATVAWERVRFGVFERIVFSIEEGPQLKIRRVSFSGNTVRKASTERLKKLIATEEYSRYIIGKRGGYATSFQLAQDGDRIKRHYASLGYNNTEVELTVNRTSGREANAAVLAAGVASGMKADGLFIHFKIIEGEVLRVRDVRIIHADKRSVAKRELEEVLELRRNAPYNPEIARNDSRALKRHYEKKGFPRTEVETTWDGSEKVLYHTIREYSQARIGKVAIRGNFKTGDWVIRDELNLREGDLLTLAKRENAQVNLRGTRLFAAVKIDYIGLDDEPNREVVNVLVNVEEREDQWMVWEIGGGFATDNPLFGELGLLFPNLFGTGLQIRLSGQWGFEIKSADFEVRLPRWMLRRVIRTAWNLTASGFLRQQKTERFGVLDSRGITLAATKRGSRGFFRDWLITLKMIEIRKRDRDEPLVRPAGPSDDISQIPVKTVTSAPGLVLNIDKRRDAAGRPNQLAPAKGWMLEFRANFAEDFIVGQNRFVKVGGSAQHYYSFGNGRFRLSNAARYDHGFPLGGDVLLPEVERFFAGGDTTVRGFEEDRLSSEVIEVPLPPNGGLSQFKIRPAGGNIRFIHNLELQLEVWKESYVWGLPIASAVFLDTGIVTNSLDDLEIRALRHSVGIALLRLLSPIGSLSVEYAIPLDPTLGDDPRGRYHINFGVQF